MRKILVFAVAAFLMAASTAMAADLKVGIVNMQKLATQCEAAQEAQKKMKATFGPEKDQLDKQAADLKKRADEMKAQFAALSPEAKEDKKVEFIRLKRDFEDKARVFARKVEAAQMRIRQDMAEMIMKAASDYAAKKGFTVILDGAAAGVIHADKSLDVTDDMLIEVNRVWHAGKK